MRFNKLKSVQLFLVLAVFYGINVSYTASFKNDPKNKGKNVKTKEVIIPVKLGATTVVGGLDVPWEITWGPDNWIWFTEQTGAINKVNPNTGERKLILKIDEVYKKRLGLLTMAIHPQIKKFPYVFVNYTVLKAEKVFMKIVRYDYKSGTLTNAKVLMEFPAHSGHMGARLSISPDGKLMVATGDFTDLKNAQNINTLNGKILRLNIDGSVPDDNPIKGNPVWARGFRVPQGLVYSKTGLLYTAEHGDANDDEVNLIRKGGNYGYPDVTGFINTAAKKAYHKINTVLEPLKAWTPTVAPAGIAYYSKGIPQWNNSILMTTLKESDLRILKLNASGDAVVEEMIYLDGQFGRLRDVCVAPNGDVYVSTSNRDWNKTNKYSNVEDDRIIRISPFKNAKGQEEVKRSIPEIALEASSQLAQKGMAGKLLYTKYCVSCHQQDGTGLADVFPPLLLAEQVSGSKALFIDIVLNGRTGPMTVKGKTYDQTMPAFNFLSDEELADVLTYVRTQFSTKNDIISKADVVKARTSATVNTQVK
jgi:glucose/arabinose dehydrogenase/mono/diheme cytochrome c family protein